MAMYDGVIRLITACPRAGQNYISRVLQKSGLEMGVPYTRKNGKPLYDDDPLLIDGTVSFYSICEPHLFDIILHQVRDPLKTISSATTETDGTYSLVFKALRHNPRDIRYKPFFDDYDKAAEESPLLSMWAWYFLNDAMEQIAEWRYRIEDIDEAYPEICRRFLVKPQPSVPDIPRNFNTRPHRNYTWAELEAVDKELCDKIREKGQEYGYD